MTVEECGHLLGVGLARVGLRLGGEQPLIKSLGGAVGENGRLIIAVRHCWPSGVWNIKPRPRTVSGLSG